MKKLLTKLTNKINKKSNKILNLLFIESTPEISEAKEKIKLNPKINILNLDNFRTKKIEEECVNLWFNKRKHKGLSLSDAIKMVKNDLNFAVALVYLNYIDVFIVGAQLSSKECFSAILKLLKKENDNFVSSTMVMNKNNEFIFMSDCALNLTLNKEEIINVAKHSQKIAYDYFEIKNNYHGYLSYITNNSFSISETKGLNIIGPIQFDSAVDVITRRKKSANLHSEIINHFIFDNISTANIVFKIYQKKLKYKTIGSFVSNLDYKVSVISRSASVDEILLTTYYMLYAFIIDKENKIKS